MHVFSMSSVIVIMSTLIKNAFLPVHTSVLSPNATTSINKTCQYLIIDNHAKYAKIIINLSKKASIVHHLTTTVKTKRI